MKETYGSVKGKVAAAAVAATVRSPPPPLTEAQKAKVAENKAFVEQHMPEFAEFVKDLYAEGLVDGWRCVQSCRLLEAGKGDK